MPLPTYTWFSPTLLSANELGTWIWITDKFGGVALMEVSVAEDRSRTYKPVGKYSEETYDGTTVVGWLPLIRPTGTENPHILGGK